MRLVLLIILFSNFALSLTRSYCLSKTDASTLVGHALKAIDDRNERLIITQQSKELVKISIVRKGTGVAIARGNRPPTDLNVAKELGYDAEIRLAQKKKKIELAFTMEAKEGAGGYSGRFRPHKFFSEFEKLYERWPEKVENCKN